MGRGTHRGFITYEELSKSLGKRNLSDENLSQAFIHILDENISLVEKKSDFKVLRKKEKSSKEEGKSIEKSDDPIRMYLREMDKIKKRVNQLKKVTTLLECISEKWVVLSFFLEKARLQ